MDKFTDSFQTGMRPRQVLIGQQDKHIFWCWSICFNVILQQIRREPIAGRDIPVAAQEIFR